MQQDIQKKLNEMGFSANVVAKILSHIFGVKSGPTFFEGLVDCQSESEFEDKLELVETKWNQYETSRCAHEKLLFFHWFKQYHSEEVKCSMLCPIQQAAGLGNPLAELFTNDSEAMNSAIKQSVKYKKSDWLPSMKKSSILFQIRWKRSVRLLLSSTLNFMNAFVFLL